MFGTGRNGLSVNAVGSMNTEAGVYKSEADPFYFFLFSGYFFVVSLKH